MKYIERSITERLRRLAEHFPVIVVTGARQVGKTTLLKHVFGEQAEYVVFDPDRDVENARSDPDLFLENHSTPLILDEIQYAPEVVSSVKRSVDADRSPGQFLLTGSQQWSVLKQISESLSGRAVILQLDGFSLSESSDVHTGDFWLESYLSDPEKFLTSGRDTFHTPFKLYEHIFRGSLPETRSLPLEVIRDFHNSYILTYIERDVRLQAQISDYQLFGRFFRLVGAYSAQEINYSELGRELGLSNKTASRWIDILKATFQWFEVPAYAANAVKRISLKPKGYLSDTGLICTGQYISSPAAISAHPLQGAVFETFAVTEILKQIHAMPSPPSYYHWRMHSGAEIDLLLERDGSFFPVEVKSNTNVSRKDTRGISSFRKNYSMLDIKSGIVIYPGEKMYQLNDNDFAVPLTLA